MKDNKTEAKNLEQKAADEEVKETKKKDHVFFGRKITVEKVEKAPKEKKEKEPKKKLSKGQIAGIAVGIGTVVGAAGKVAFDILASRNADQSALDSEDVCVEIPADEPVESSEENSGEVV